jgi:hypothetical protein
MKTIQLQSIGKRKATEAKNIKVGDTLIWNFGYTTKVLEIVKETAHTIIIRSINESGKIHDRRLGKERLVAIQGL